MDRSHVRVRPRGGQKVAMLLLAAALVPAAGCVHALATAAYVWNGGNLVDAEYDGLVGKRAVVVCRPPASLGFRYPHVDRDLARRVSYLLEINVKDVDVVDQREVDNWIDEDDVENFKDLAKAVNADVVVLLDLEEFSLTKGPTLYQGMAEVTLSVYDMQNNGKLVWEKELGENRFPSVGGVPTADKTQDQFREQYLTVLSERFARHFYKHEAHLDFALDATAQR